MLQDLNTQYEAFRESLLNKIQARGYETTIDDIDCIVSWIIIFSVLLTVIISLALGIRSYERYVSPQTINPVVIVPR